MLSTHLYRTSGLGFKAAHRRVRLPPRPAPARPFATSPRCSTPLTRSPTSESSTESSLVAGLLRLQIVRPRLEANSPTARPPPQRRVSANQFSTKQGGYPVAFGLRQRDRRWFSAGAGRNAHRSQEGAKVPLTDWADAVSEWSPDQPSRTGPEHATPAKPGDPISNKPRDYMFNKSRDGIFNKPRDDISENNRRPAKRQRLAGRPGDQRQGNRHEKAQVWDYKVPQMDAKEKKKRYIQWGYLRHQYTGNEQKVAQRDFTKWVRGFETVKSSSPPPDLPWATDGKWIYELDHVAQMRRKWEDQDDESRHRAWPNMMLSTLLSRPSKALKVLEATLDPLPPGYAIADVLTVIAQRLWLTHTMSQWEREAEGDQIIELLAYLFETVPPNYVELQERTLGAFARGIPRKHVKELYDMIKRSGRKLHPHTRLHFASKFAGDPALKQEAFTILKDLSEEGVDLSAPKAASALTSLFHGTKFNSRQDHGFSPQEALQHFMATGMKPNTVTLTSFLNNLCRRGEVDEAIRLALLFSESGVPLDAKTCSTIFAGAKATQKADVVEKALDVAKVADIPFISVLNHMLHAAFYFATMESRDLRSRPPWTLPLFMPLLEIYRKKFELPLLQSFLPDDLTQLASQPNRVAQKFKDDPGETWSSLGSILSVADKLFTEGPQDGGDLRPNLTTLGLMLRSYIRSLDSFYDIVAAYKFFKSRLEEHGDEFSEMLIESQRTIIHDTFIMVMVESKGHTRAALQVFGDMLKFNLDQANASASEALREYQEKVEGQAKGGEGTSKPKKPVHPAPSVYTFTILLRGLLAQKEDALAEQIMQVMREHGVEPNLATWNTVIKGHASRQNVKGTVGTLQDLEAAGLEPDDNTYYAFRSLRKQDRALKMMEAIIDANAKELMTEPSQVGGTL